MAGAKRIEDYALVGDLQTAALVGRDGSVDWLCVPRFDSASCFSALLGEPSHGRWLIAPAGEIRATSRRYRPGTLILETDFETDDGAVRVIDFMPRRRGGAPQLVRIVEGLRGRVPMRLELIVRPDYGSIAPAVRATGTGGVVAQAGPDSFRLTGSVELAVRERTVEASFDVVEEGHARFVLGWHDSFSRPPVVEDAHAALARAESFWRDWSGRCAYEGEYREAVLTSLIALKAMTDETTGAIVAAPTTSLPEDVGGVRNWDYRFCWLRDAALTLNALVGCGYRDEALAFRDYVFAVGTGDPAALQIMYGIGGERRLTELELDWLPGYEGSRPVHAGNAAAGQFQLDVYGEVLGVSYLASRTLGMRPDGHMLQRWIGVVEHVEKVWREPDDGIWEVRGPRRHFTHSKVMAWLVFDIAVRLIESGGIDAPLERFINVRDEIHAEVCERGFDSERGTFTQYYGSRELDAAVLLIPLVGFLPADDERVSSTIDVVRSELARDGLLSRYSTGHTDDGLPGSEAQFLACSFWLAGALALNGRRDEARELFERLLALRNDIGLLAEMYDVDRRRQVGNFPQAFSHLALINAARIISGERLRAA